MGVLGGISPDQRARADRLKVRLAAWPVGARPGDSKDFCEAAAPVVLPLMFDKAEIEFQFQDHPATYRLTVWEPVFNTIRLNSGSWFWVVGDGSCEGRGLVSLWSWRFDVSCTDAHTTIMAWLSHHENLSSRPKRQRKAA